MRPFLLSGLEYKNHRPGTRQDLERHRRNEQQFRDQIVRAHRRLEESDVLLQRIDAALQRFGGGLVTMRS